MVCNKVYWENINPSMKTKKAQLVFHVWLKLVQRVFDLCEELLLGEVASAATIFKRICFVEGNLVLNVVVYLWSTSVVNSTATLHHLFSMSKHLQGFCVKVLLDDNWCCYPAKQYNKGWGNKRRRGCVFPVVCLTILSHVLIAQSPLLAPAQAETQSSCKSTLAVLCWSRFNRVWEHRHVLGFAMLIKQETTFYIKTSNSKICSDDVCN